jgi:hypothetical protein
VRKSCHGEKKYLFVYNKVMRVFTTFNETLPTANQKTTSSKSKKNGPANIKKSYRPPRLDLSPEEIKAKVASKTTSKKEVVENLSGKQVSTFMSESAAATKTDIRTKATTATAVKGLGDPEKVDDPKAKEVLLHSDVQKNDPKDTNVQEKLKGLLGSGGFGWNDKERAALSEILGKS